MVSRVFVVEVARDSSSSSQTARHFERIREGERDLGICGSAEAASRYYMEDAAVYKRACEERGEFPDEDIGLFTCEPCWKKWRE